MMSAAGRTTAAVSEPMLTLRVKATAATKLKNATSVGSQASPKNTPPVVATPFPPPCPMRKTGFT
jgi:hypothetical protein